MNLPKEPSALAGLEAQLRCALCCLECVQESMEGGREHDALFLIIRQMRDVHEGLAGLVGGVSR